MIKQTKIAVQCPAISKMSQRYCGTKIGKCVKCGCF